MSASKPNKFNLKEIEQTVIAHVSENVSDSVQTTELHLNIKRQAVRDLLKHVFAKAGEIARISSGIAIVKGLSEISSTEIEQAIEMSEQGIYNFLPQESW